MKRLIIPSVKNKHRPYLIRSKALAIYSILLITFQLGFGYVAKSRQGEVIAATTITASELFQLTNDERAEKGLPLLTYNEKLAQAAYNKGVDMFADQYWAHNAPDGTTPWDFILAVGYDYHYAGENLAKDFTNASSVVTAWMNSPSHRDNIINQNFKDMGIAVVTGIFENQETAICVQMFGTVMPVVTETETEEEEQIEQSSTTPTTQSTETPPEITPEPEPTPEMPSPAQPSPTETPIVEEPADTSPPKPPVIIEPQNNALLSEDRPKISGISDEPATITVYDAQNKLGSLPTDTENAFSFRPKKSLKEGEHLFSATATDDSGNKSDHSSMVTVIIDTFPPFIDEDSIALESYYRFGQKALRIEVIVLADPQQVTASLGDYSLILKGMENNRYTGIIVPQADLFDRYKKVVIKSHDQAGNYIQAIKTIPLFPEKTPEQSTGAILGTIQQSGKQFLGQIVPKNYQETNRMFYSFFGIGLMGLMTINTAVIEKKKIPTEGTNTLTHAVMIGISLLGVIWGNLGMITSGLNTIR